LSFVPYIVAASLLCTAAAAAESAKPTPPETGRSVIITTDKGTIKIALFEKDAPITTKNFIELVERKFYDGLTFHRVIPDVLIQGGDPEGTGMGGSGKTIKLEVSPKLKHDAPGIVAMARRPDPDFDSATSQFYITMVPIPRLDMGYAVFGRVTEGMDVVRNIKIGDVMKTVRMAPKPKPKSTTPPKKSNPKPGGK
jgi:peptidyl-prolyl cis-trans isomerase B (cyclophilin B)